MISESAKVFARVIPEQFRGPDFVVRGNLIFKKDANGNLLRGAVGQLEDGMELNLPGKSAARLFGGDAALTRLSQVGNIASVVGAVASVINLGVCVAGFMHVSRSLKRVERRLENIERSLERIEGMLGIIDQKIDQLVYLSDLQLHALSDIGELIKSYKTAEVHGALETLQFRLRHTDMSEVVYDVREAIKTLQEYRIWLSDRRQGKDLPLPVRVEILRAEVLVTLAESRARCFVKDEAYAVSCIEQLLENVRDEFRSAWDSIIEEHGTHVVFSNDEEENEDWLDALVWLKGTSLKDVSNELLKQMATHNASDRFEEETQIVQVIEDKYEEATSLLENLGLNEAVGNLKKEYLEKESGEMLTIELKSSHASAIRDIFCEFNILYYREEVGESSKVSFGIFGLPIELVSERNDEDEESKRKDADDNTKRDKVAADIASLTLCYRLARDVERALSVCAVMEAVGNPVRHLLLAKEEPWSPAVVIEMREPVEAD